MRAFSVFVACALLLAPSLRAQEEEDEARPEEPAAAPAEAPNVRLSSKQRQLYRPGATSAPARASRSAAAQEAGGERYEDVEDSAPAEEDSGSAARAPTPSSQASPRRALNGRMRLRGLSGGKRGLSGGTRGMRGLRGLGAGGGAGFDGGAAAGAGPGSGGSRAPGPTHETLGQLATVNLAGRHASAAGAADGTAAMNSRAWDGGALRNVGVNGPGGAGGSGGSRPRVPTGDGSGPILSDAPQVTVHEGVNVTPWQGLLDKAQALMKRAGQLVATSSLMVFAGKQLAKTGFGGSFGAGLIAAGMVIAAAAAGLAAAATVLGSIILLKHKQKLQGAVITVSALALTIAAIKAAQGNRAAYNDYKSAENRAILRAAEQAKGGMSLNSVFMNRDGLSAIRTGANFAIGDTKAGSYMNASFGLYDGVAGLAAGGGAVAGLKAGLGLAQTWQGVAPTKGQAGDVLRTALTGAQIATDMWTPKPKVTTKEEFKAKDGPLAADGSAPPVLESRPISGTAALPPGAEPSNPVLIAAAAAPLALLPSRPLGDYLGLAPAVAPRNPALTAAMNEPISLLPSRPLGGYLGLAAPAAAPPVLASRPLDLSLLGSAVPLPAIPPLDSRPIDPKLLGSALPPPAAPKPSGVPGIEPENTSAGAALKAAANEPIAMLPSRLLEAMLALPPLPVDPGLPGATKDAPKIPVLESRPLDLTQVGTQLPGPVAPQGASVQAVAGPKPAAKPADPKANEPAYENAKAILVAQGRDPKLVDQAVNEAKKQGLDPLLALSVINAESQFNPNATSYKTERVLKKGEIDPVTKLPAPKDKYAYVRDASGNKVPIARGMMQITDSTGKWLGVDNPSKELYNPQTNLQAGIGYLKTLVDDLGTKLGVAAYNAGPGAVAKYKGVPPFQETQGYVVKVLETQSLLEAGVVPPPKPAKSSPAPRRRSTGG